MALALRIFAYVWFAISAGIVLFGLVGIYLRDGFSGVQEVMSPFNVVNSLLVLLLISPGLGALALSERLRRRAP